MAEPSSIDIDYVQEIAFMGCLSHNSQINWGEPATYHWNLASTLQKITPSWDLGFVEKMSI